MIVVYKDSTLRADVRLLVQQELYHCLIVSVDECLHCIDSKYAGDCTLSLNLEFE